ncbi:MAG TPA: hypothetical protein VNA89_15580 [Gemmatimonadaceae bacterium]|nr:hypothetical protein [Gemmatimonadaceae bacterium]
MGLSAPPDMRGLGPEYVEALTLDEDDVRFGDLNAFVRRHRVALSAAVVVGALAGAAVAVALPRTYTARGSFAPQGGTQLSGLASLAAQFGVGLPLPDPGRSPAFYSKLLQTKTVLTHVVERRYALAGDDGRRVTLTEFLRGRGSSAGERTESAIKKLRRRTALTIDQKASTVGIEVRMRDPYVARDVARAFLAEVDSFNLHTRQTQAGSERQFTEGRVASARTELLRAEGALRDFLQRNRGDFRGSPQLSFLHDRLERDVLLKQDLYTTLAKAYEQARVEEVRDTPVVTVVEQPMLPARADTPPYVRSIALALLLCVGAAVVVGRRRDRRAAGRA